MRICKTYGEDINKMKWLKETYLEYSIADKMTHKITELIWSIDFEKNDQYNKEKVLDLSKAIRQDFKKMILTCKKIHDYSLKDNCNKPLYVVNENDRAEPYYDEEKDIVEMAMEYYLSKYRVIVEYTINILDILIKIDWKEYKKKYPGKVNKYGRVILNKNEIQEVKLDYLKSLISENARYSVLNTEWFDNLRFTRNEIIHNGASCMIFDGKDILFQIYDLNVDEVVCTERYLSNGNAIYWDYFIASTIAYLVYFIDTIFSILIQTKHDSNDIKKFCCKKYRIKANDESASITKLFERFGYNFDYISEAQKRIFIIVDKYLTQLSQIKIGVKAFIFNN